MERTVDNPLDYLPDHRTPDETVDPTMSNSDILHTDLASSAVAAKEKDHENSLFVPDRTTTLPEPDQPRIKQEVDVDGDNVEHNEDEEGIDDGSLQNVSTSTPQDENTEGGLPSSSSDNKESESSWAVAKGKTAMKFIFKNSATSKQPKQGSDVANIDEFKRLTKDLQKWTTTKTEYEAQLKLDPGDSVSKTMVEVCKTKIKEFEGKLGDVETGMQTEDLNKEASSDAVASGKAKPPPRKRRKVAKTEEELQKRKHKRLESNLDRKNAKNEGKRKSLYDEPVPATASSAERRGAKNEAAKINKRIRDLVSMPSSDDTIAAPKAEQSASVAHELSDATDQDEKSKILEEKAIKRDIVRLKAAAQALGDFCRAVDESNLADTRWEIDGVKSTLSHHQLLGIEWMLTKEKSDDHGGMNADDMGMGKTLQALACTVLRKPPKDKPEPTLIVVPSHAITTWTDQIKEHLDVERSFTYTIFQAKKNENMNTLEKFNIIFVSSMELIRTYKSMKVQQQTESPDGTSEEGGETTDEPAGMLFQMEFFRVIVDEAHCMKNPNSLTYHASYALKAKHRDMAIPIVHTGTLAIEQSRFQPQIKESGHQRERGATRKTDRCDYDQESDKIAGKVAWKAEAKDTEVVWIKQSEEESVLYQYLDNRTCQIAARYQQKAKEEVKSRNPRGISLYINLLNILRQASAHPFLLEKAMKTKMCGADIRKIQESLKGLGKTPLFKQLEVYIDEGGMKNFGTSRFGSELDLYGLLDLILDGIDDILCHACGTELTEPQKNQCGHPFCLCCIVAEVEEAREAGKAKAKCPTCKKPLHSWIPVEIPDSALSQEDEQANDEQFSAEDRAAFERHGVNLKEVAACKARKEAKERRNARRMSAKKGKDGKKLGNDYLNVQPSAKDTLEDTSNLFLEALDRDYPEPLTPSAKTTMVKSIVIDWQEEAPDDKIIIFTQFVQLGQILGRMLQAEGIQFLYYFGEMSKVQKDTAVKTFRTEKSAKVMIVSLKCGGTALNLQCANRVIMVDPWWNESIENQAFARVFRQGQKKKTYLRRILVKGTADERIYQMQLRKRANIDQTMNSQDYLRMLGSTTEDEDGNLITEADYDI
ncbi:Helicase-like transcription factor [Apiospora saccharicola]